MYDRHSPATTQIIQAEDFNIQCTSITKDGWQGIGPEPMERKKLTEKLENKDPTTMGVLASFLQVPFDKE